MKKAQRSAGKKAGDAGNRATIDIMLEEITKHTSISLDKLSTKLGISKETAEGWAEVLEKNGLIELEYSFLGSPKIKLKGKPEKEVKELMPTPSKKPMGLIVILLLAVATLLAAQISGLIGGTDEQRGRGTLVLSQSGGVGNQGAHVITTPFDENKDSATYTAIVDLDELGIDEYQVYMDQGKIAVDMPAPKGRAVSRAGMYYRVYRGGGGIAIDKETFEAEVGLVMPSKYIDMLREKPAGGSKTFAPGGSCLEFTLSNGDTLCVREDNGFPLRYVTTNLNVVFKDINFNPHIDETVFQI